MKRLGWIFMFLLTASPAWAARKITVEQLKDLLVSLKQAQKTDADVAAELGNVELTEELAHNTMNGLGAYLPGELSKEQIFVLEVRSAVLAPPAGDLPATPAPDAATQKAILDKALDYATKTYAQLPNLTATKTARRFQDNIEPIQGSKAAHSSAVVAIPTAPIRYMTGAETQAALQNGAELNPLVKDKTRWGANGMIALLGQGPDLATILQEANSAEKISWLRWEMIMGKQVAVYSFAVDKKRTHYAVNYCCFPDSDQAGPLTMRGTGQQAGSGPGNYQSNTNWKNYKSTVPYHGEIFVDPDTGIVVRLITEAEFKSSELVRQEDQRIDYGPETVGDKTLVLPVRSYINTLALPDGDTETGRLNMRHTLFISEYKNYQPAGS
jgi:hypothetical protein